jgi:8-oxo-dGTP diphosphatase
MAPQRMDRPGMSTLEEHEMTSLRFKALVAVHLFLLRPGQILLARRYNTGFQDGSYSVIAGHLDGAEAATSAMTREAREEAGITIREADLKLVHVMHRKSADEWIDLFFTAASWKEEPTIKEPDKCDDLGWFPLTELPENMVPYVRAALERVQEGSAFSEFGWAERNDG